MAAHLYWRLLISSVENPAPNPVDGWVAIADIEFRSSVGAPDQATGGAATASSVFFSQAEFAADKSFDADQLNTGWSSDIEPVPATPEWIAYQFSTPVEIRQVALRSYIDEPGQAPAMFAVQYSDNGINYTTDSSFNADPWANGVEQTFNLSAAVEAARGQLRQSYALLQSVQSSLTQLWGDEAARGQFRQRYGERFSAGLRQRWGDQLMLSLRQTYDLRVSRSLNQPYKASLGASLRQPYSHTISAGLSQRWSLLTRVASSLRQRHGDEVRVAQQLRQQYSFLAINPVAASLGQTYAMSDPVATVLSTPATLLSAGHQIAMGRYQVSFGEDAWNWRASIEVLDGADFARLRRDDELTLTIGADQWTLLVDGKSLNRASQGGQPVIQQVVDCVGVAARYDSPRAQRISITDQPAIDAQTVAESILGTAITWQISSWTIPARRLSATDASPVEVVRSIVATVGGMLQAQPDGALLARHRFPVPVPEWQTTPADQLYTDLGDILELHELQRLHDPVDSVVVADEIASPATLQLEVDTRQQGLNGGALSFAPGAGVAVLGFRPRSVGIQSTEITAGSLTDDAPQPVEVTEDLLFGTGPVTTNRPVDQILSAVWLGKDLGAVTLASDQKTLTAAQAGVAMLRLSYIALADAWRINTPAAAGGSDEFTVGMVAEYEQ